MTPKLTSRLLYFYTSSVYKALLIGSSRAGYGTTERFLWICIKETKSSDSHIVEIVSGFRQKARPRNAPLQAVNHLDLLKT